MSVSLATFVSMMAPYIRGRGSNGPLFIRMVMDGFSLVASPVRGGHLRGSVTEVSVVFL